MKALKILYVLFCLLAFVWAFSRPMHAQAAQPASTISQNQAAVTDTRPFNALIERASPLYVDRQMTLKVADIPAGQQVKVLQKTDMNRGNRLVVLLVTYADKDGKEKHGWVYGTLHVHLPR